MNTSITLSAAEELIQKARQLAREDDSEAVWARNWALSSVAEQYVETGKYEQALVIASTLKDDTPKAGVLASVAAKYAAAGMKEQAFELLV